MSPPALPSPFSAIEYNHPLLFGPERIVTVSSMSWMALVYPCVSLCIPVYPCVSLCLPVSPCVSEPFLPSREIGLCTSRELGVPSKPLIGGSAGPFFAIFSEVPPSLSTTCFQVL